METSQHEMRVLSGKGDLKVVWSATNPDEVESARRQFEELRKKGFSAFEVGRLGKAGTRMDEFDPEAEKVILTPPLRGGV